MVELQTRYDTSDFVSICYLPGSNTNSLVAPFRSFATNTATLCDCPLHGLISAGVVGEGPLPSDEGPLPADEGPLSLGLVKSRSLRRYR